MDEVDSAWPDDQFTEFLAAYDEALQAGRVPETPALDSTPPDQRVRLMGALELLRRLERRRPRSASASGPITPAASSPEPGPSSIGRFRILRALGHGGFGIVFLASDPALGREVALKVPRPEAVLTPELRQRFLREGQAAAALAHPNLVPVFEAGEAGPVCYLVSAYCPGPTLHDWLRGQASPVPPRVAARLVADLAGAVAYMHGRGILHRDIKPANVLLEPGRADGPDGLEFMPRLTDFGLAKVLEENQTMTRTGALLGTPAYMAPEQATGRRQGIGPAADVYALGVVLYELLTGRPPFQGETELETLRQVASEEPVPPRRHRRELARDLETVCLKCLEKDPARRYPGAGELADDLGRFLNGEAIRARPPGRWERAARWAYRRRVSLLIGVLLGLLGFGSLGAAWWNADRERRHAEDARAAREQEERQAADIQRMRRLLALELRVRHRAYARGVSQADRFLEEGVLERAQSFLEDERPRAGEADLRGFEWFHLRFPYAARPARDWKVGRIGEAQLALSPDGKTLAAGLADGLVELRDPSSGAVRAALRLDQAGSVSALAFSPDGQLLAAGAPGRQGDSGAARLWDVGSGRPRASVPGLTSQVDAVAFSPDGRTLAVANYQRPGSAKSEEDDRVLLWDVREGRVRRTLRLPPGARPHGLAFTLSGHLLAACKDGVMRGSEDLASWKVFASLGTAHPAWCVATSPRFQSAAAWGTRTSRVHWSTENYDGGPRLALDEGIAQGVWSVAWTRNTPLLAVGGGGGDIFLLEATTRRVLGAFQAHRQPVRSLAFTPDAGGLFSASTDGTIKFWEVAPLLRVVRHSGHLPKEAWCVAFAPDGKVLASSGDDHVVRLWDAATGRELGVLRGHGSLVTCVAFSPDGQLLASASLDRTVRLWEAGSGRQLQVLAHAQQVRCLAFAPDGRILAAAGGDYVPRMPGKAGELKLWEASTGRKRAAWSGHARKVRALQFSPDGKLLASCGDDGFVHVWDPGRPGSPPLRSMEDPSELQALAFIRDGKTLGVGTSQGQVRLWDVGTWEEQPAFRVDNAGVRALAFSPDGKTLATGGEDKMVRLWDVAAGQAVVTFRDGIAGGGVVNSVTFAPDGRAFAFASLAGGMEFWRAFGLED
jgi:WD40 repeat protein